MIPDTRARGTACGVIVIGVGNKFRRDDGVGPLVLARLRQAVPDSVRLAVSDGEPTGLVEAWTGAELAVVVDALRADPADAPAPGRTHRLVIDQVAAEPVSTVSSHGLGLGDAIGLAQALGRMPNRLVIHAVEVTDCGYGVGLSPAVAAAAERLTSAVLRELAVGSA